MATSGTTAFDLNVDELIEEAFERCGLELRTGYDLETARRSLNLMFADWSNRGLNLWVIEERTESLTEGTASYDLDVDLVNVLSAVIRTTSGSTTTDYQVNRISRSDYHYLPDKTIKARPTQFYVERSITPKLYLYPAPENSTDVFRYYALTRIQDAGVFTNTLEITFQFLPAMVAGLAYYIAMKRAPERIQLLKQVYDEEWQRASLENIDTVSSRFLPSRTVI
jgi:hypothetical protein|tara:strand:- start:287 stop:958 length:672 start_codon:yes stop_codon:yes gene_type:complete